MKQFFEVLREILLGFFRAETTTRAGQMNFALMVLGLVAAVAMSIPPWLEALVKLIRPEAEVGTDLPTIFLYFLAALLLCLVIVTLLDRSSNE